MVVLKICLSYWENASRDQRELCVCRELGADVLVLAKGQETDRGRVDNVNGFRVHRYTTRPYKRIPTLLNRVISVFQWAKYAGSLNADIISGHDIGGWTIGWLSRFYSKKNRPKLVYDSHEYELGRNIKRNFLQKSIIKIWEKIVIRKSIFTIVVNDSIADELVKVYNLKEKPVVVRNIPNRWNIREDVTKKVRQELLDAFSGRYILIYHGSICKNRGIEQILFAIREHPDNNLLIVGNFESSEYKKDLEELIMPVKSQVIVKRAVPHDELWKYIGAADICVAPIIPKYKSYYFALPNKLFEAIQARTPLLVSDLPEMRKIIKEYEIGEVMNTLNLEDVCSKISVLIKNGKEYYRDNLEKAANELVWDKEKEKLSKVYKKIII